MSIWKQLPKFAAIVAIAAGLAGCGVNTIPTKDQAVKARWADVQAAYQRRADLIPNLVNTVKGYANFEQQTLTAVVQARASATQVKLDPNDLTPENIQRFEQAQQGLSGALGKLLMLTENYPDLKANQSFLGLQQQLEGTENRIKVSRDAFNQSVKDYNIRVSNFPNNILACIFHMNERQSFQAEAGAQNAPKVHF